MTSERINWLVEQIPAHEQAECRQLIEWAVSQNWEDIGYWTGDEDADLSDLVGNKPYGPTTELTIHGKKVPIEARLAFIKSEKWLYDQIAHQIDTDDYWLWLETPNEKLDNKTPMEVIEKHGYRGLDKFKSLMGLK